MHYPTVCALSIPTAKVEGYVSMVHVLNASKIVTALLVILVIPTHLLVSIAPVEVLNVRRDLAVMRVLDAVPLDAIRTRTVYSPMSWIVTLPQVNATI